MPSDRRGLAPRKQPRQIRAELTRERILDAAAHVFGEYGYAAGTTNRIAERARVSIGSLYQYYPNKDAILVELVTRHLDSGGAAVARSQAQELPDTLEGVLRLFVRTAIDNHLDDPRLLRVMAEQAPRSAELLAKVEAHETERFAYIEELLAKHPEVRVTDTYTATRLLVTTVELVVHKVIAAPDPIDVRRFEDELVAMLHRYLTGPSETVGPRTA
ncbi:TetR/AcrR family transcriptional regulator [Streptomyces durmitorensis]|uniref:TetR/AcrR family transcriptional regulator n=1 Tax=Streptomyces durmitorensis TaxID=319947 RepID=A0ABY4PJS2_9ACTN|nr:TetR/AcrR family transcriptional regulator [Streptomyces durmitorensis]UQT53866.1 TetR/AcrR family transcriptional regulator [Streptomyces durmitorensis]